MASLLFTSPSPRVVSLLPSATEIVAALGFVDNLVGRSHECDFPLPVRGLPGLTRPMLDFELPSGEIERRVKDLMERALSIYEVDAEVLRRLAPDVIVTQTQCQVCAVSLADVKDALAAWTGGAPNLVALHPGCLRDVRADIRRVAEALDAETAGEELIASMRARMDAIADRAQALDPRPSVACIEWIEPIMAGGNWIPELVAMAGGRDLLGKPAAHSDWITFEALAAADPEVILVQPCGFDIARTRAEMSALTALPGWRDLRAVRDTQVYLTDGNRYFNRPGPRLVDSLEILAEILQPDSFDFGHRGDGWSRYEA
jgi:iron complex transport system substrate-binding protein